MSSNIYPCTKCGKLITRKGKLCVVCYKAQRKQEAISKGRKIRVRDRSSKKQAISNFHKCVKCGKRILHIGICDLCRKNGSYQKQTVIISKCSKSKTKAHHWIIDSEHKGVCLYCKKTRNFEIKSTYE